MPNWLAVAVDPSFADDVSLENTLSGAFTGLGLALLATGLVWKILGRKDSSSNNYTRHLVTGAGWVTAVAGLYFEILDGDVSFWGPAGLGLLLVGALWNWICERQGFADINAVPVAVTTLGWIVAVGGTASAWADNFGVGLVVSCLGYGGGIALVLWLGVLITQPGADRRQQQKAQENSKMLARKH